MISDLKRKCINELEMLGDAALKLGEHAEAISRYSSAWSLDPSLNRELL